MNIMRRRPLHLALVSLLLLSAGFDWSGKLKAKAAGLTSEDPQERIRTLHELARLDIAQTKPYLLALLRDPHQAVRLDTANVLARHKEVAAVKPLSAWLTSQDKKERRVAATVLGEIGAAEATGPLTRTLSDPEAMVRQAATEALGKLGGSAVIVPIIGRLDDTDAGVRTEAAEQLLAVGDARAVIPLLERFSDTSKEVRVAAIKAVGKLGDGRAVSAILRVLRDSLPEVQIVAVQALGNLRATSAVPELVALLKPHQSSTLRASVALALGHIGAEEGIVAMVQGLKGNPQAVREGLLVAGPKAVEPLLECLHGRLDCEPSLAVELLGKVGDKRAVSAIIRELDRGRVRRDLIVQTLGTLGDQRAQIALLGLLEDADPSIREQALRVVILDARAADIVIRLLDDDHADIVAQATIHAGQLRSGAAVPKLLSILQSPPDNRVLGHVLHALGEIGDRRASAPLLALLSNKDQDIRQAAADSLAVLRDPATITPLLQLAAVANPGMRSRLHTSVRQGALTALRGVLRNAKHPAARKALETWAATPPQATALYALGVLAAMADAKSLDALIRLSTRPGRPVQEGALSALGDLGNTNATPALRAALRIRDDRLSGAAAWSLGKLADKKALPDLHKAVRSEAWATRINATAALARISAIGSLTKPARRLLLSDAKILSADRDPHVRANAATALGHLLPKSRHEPLLKLATDDKNPYVRALAARALRHFPGAQSFLRSMAEDDRHDFVKAMAQAATNSTKTELAHLVWRNTDGKPLLGWRYVLVDPRGTVKAGYIDLRGQTNEENIGIGWRYELLDGSGGYDNTREL